MALQSFSETLTVRVVADDSDKIFLGSIEPDVVMDMRFIRPFIYMQGIPSGMVKINLHTSTNLNRVYASSNELKLSSFSLGANTLSFVRFDFEKAILSPNFIYYLSIETTDYERDNDASYLSFVYDYPLSINLIGATQTATSIEDFPKAFEAFALR